MIAYGVPDLELDVFIVDLDGAGTEFNTDREVVLLAEAFVRELKEQARFANT